jgi:hypothetical protein
LAIVPPPAKAIDRTFIRKEAAACISDQKSPDSRTYVSDNKSDLFAKKSEKLPLVLRSGVA